MRHLFLAFAFVAAVLFSGQTTAQANSNSTAMAELSTSLQQTLSTLAEGNEDPNVAAAIAKLDEALTTDYGKFSKSIKKVAKAVGKLDKLLVGNETYETAMDDVFIDLVELQMAQCFRDGVFAAGQAVARGNLGAARSITKLNKLNDKLQAKRADPASSRKKILKAMFKVAKLGEKLTNKFG